MHDFLNEIWATIGRNKLRTALTGFAVMWGIFILIVLLGAGNGLINALTANNEAFLSNSAIVYGGYTSEPYQGMSEGRAIALNDRDQRTTRQVFPQHIDQVGSELSHSGTTLSTEGRYVTNVSLNGVYPNELAINKRALIHGRFINDADMRQRRKTIVISDDLARELEPQNTSQLVGKHLTADSIAYLVVGIYEQDQTMMGSEVFIPFTTYRTLFGSGDRVGNITFTFHGLDSEQANEDFEKQYRAHINSAHNASPTDESAIWIWNRFTQNLQMNSATDIIRTALWVIGILTLLSGIVGVSNIMLITVKERTREFGIRKAIGASPWSILRLILAESIAITTFFGYLGMLLGIAANLYMDATIGQTKLDVGLWSVRMFLNPTVGLATCVEATVVMVVAGSLAGLIPARRAARIRPIEALRSE